MKPAVWGSVSPVPVPCLTGAELAVPYNECCTQHAEAELARPGMDVAKPNSESKAKPNPKSASRITPTEQLP